MIGAGAPAPAKPRENPVVRLIRSVDYTAYGSLIALVVLFIASAFASPVFLQSANLINIARQVSYEGYIAIGMTFVIIAGGIDLSVGSAAAFTGGLVVLVINHFQGTPGSIAIGVLAGLVIGPCLGLFNGLIVTKGRVAPFIVTLGTLGIFRSLTLYVANGGEFRSMSGEYANIGTGSLGPIPYPVVLLAVLALVAHVVLTRTRFGRYVFAVGSNERVARYSAISVDSVRLMTYAVVGLCVSLSAIMISSRLNSVSSSTTGLSYELNAIAAVIIGGASMSGGRGTILGTVVGALMLGIVNNMLNMMNVSAYLQGVVKGVIIIVAVLVQRQNGRD